MIIKSHTLTHPEVTEHLMVTNFIKIETTGLSFKNDALFQVSVLNCATGKLLVNTVENLKEEVSLMTIFSEPFCVISAFEKQFILEKLAFYAIPAPLSYDLQTLYKNFKHILKLDKVNTAALFKHLGMKPSAESGYAIAKRIRSVLMTHGDPLPIIAQGLAAISDGLKLLSCYDTLYRTLAFSIDEADFMPHHITFKGDFLHITGLTTSPLTLDSFDAGSQLQLSGGAFTYRREVTAGCYLHGETVRFIQKEDLSDTSGLQSPPSLYLLYCDTPLYGNIIQCLQCDITAHLRQSCHR
ncbi:hypothetical protein O6R05_01765 [Peptoniphilus equinus]|uniref:Uncharacterized protein n=1 Tax=Peptoniphilus equinus TaxID=3016343 RepID=A0ABY7QU83_9FIRM|nr:hypothetical protein [Peptoniphilus equinus]WBW50292.1 hypothetical protein O6R05_01765 [Peptoniphilus equinus]